MSTPMTLAERLAFTSALSDSNSGPQTSDPPAAQGAQTVDDDGLADLASHRPALPLAGQKRRSNEQQAAHDCAVHAAQKLKLSCKDASTLESYAKVCAQSCLCIVYWQ